MAVNPDDPTTPTSCATATLPDVSFDLCAPTLNFGFIRNLYVFKKPFAATPTAITVAAALAAYATDPDDEDAAVLLVVEMSGGNDGGGNVERYNGQDIPRPGDLTYNVTIKDTSTKNWEFARTTQKGGYPGYFYGVDSNGNWFGGQNGIFGHARLILRGQIPTDENGLQSITGTIKGRGFFDPKRIVSPVPLVEAA